MQQLVEAFPRGIMSLISSSSRVARQHHNAAIQRPSAGTRVAKGDFVLARQSDSSIHRQGRGPKLIHEKWTGPWKVMGVVLEGLSVVIDMEGRATRSRTVSTASLKLVLHEAVRPSTPNGG